MALQGHSVAATAVLDAGGFGFGSGRGTGRADGIGSAIRAGNSRKREIFRALSVRYDGRIPFLPLLP